MKYLCLIFSAFRLLRYLFHFSYGQTETKFTHKIELLGRPVLLHNYAHIGYSIQRQNKNEHAIFLSGFYSITPPMVNLNVSHSYNIYTKSQLLYLPI